MPEFPKSNYKNTCTCENFELSSSLGSVTIAYFSPALLDSIIACVVMRGSRKFCQTLRTFFLMSGERIQIGLKAGIIGLPAKRHLNGPTLSAGLVAL